ncbi:hypothetical protein LTR37_000016 [Vermiconidia calcicola]|uniref:Uncharacterized protein n=1 Tax=Vermiconidia calcicola TaxID=1690605 RepID=A0ACC3NZ47_9PEZI|nr:hypothetical protein LTR37_000016 [Vermiconidia calcicola]
MSSSEAFPALTGLVTPGSMADVSDITSTGWYAPATYAYNEPYMTPYQTSSVDDQAWTQFARASIPNISVPNYMMHPPHFQHQQIPQQFAKDQSRPRSSPSTFGPGAEHVSWPSSNGLGIYPSTGGQPTPPITSTFPPSVFQTYGSEEPYAASTTPEIRQPVPKRPFPTIAPNPEQVAAQKRKRDEEEHQQENTLSASKKRKRTSSVASADLSEDDRFLVQLKEKEELPWKDIANRFQTDMGKNFQVAALQMRYKRLREKFRIWQDEDVKALNAAHEYWDKYKWEIIAAKMLDYGVNERWPARHCARKWQEVEATASMAASAGMTPAMTHYSSPIEGPTHFAWMPLH